MIRRGEAVRVRGGEKDGRPGVVLRILIVCPPSFLVELQALFGL
jgi:hypothetical protein